MPTEMNIVSYPPGDVVTLGTRLAGEDMDADIIRAAPTGQVTWVTNTTSEQVVKSSPGKLLRLVIGSASAAAAR